MMNCPKCSGAPLEEKRAAEDLIVDLCAACGGAWLDRGEIYRFVTRPAELQKQLEKAYPKAAASGHSCPRCRKGMARASLPGSGIEFEVCPDCGGTWMDRGELQSLRKALEPPEAKPSAAAPPAPAKRSWEAPMLTPRPSGETALLWLGVLAACGLFALVAGRVVARVLRSVL